MLHVEAYSEGRQISKIELFMKMVAEADIGLLQHPRWSA